MKGETMMTSFFEALGPKLEWIFELGRNQTYSNIVGWKFKVKSLNPNIKIKIKGHIKVLNFLNE